MLAFEYSTVNPEMPVAYGSFRAMHTLCEVLVAGVGRERADALMQQVHGRIMALEAKFSRFDPQSVVSRINRSEAGTEIVVDDELYGVLEMCRVFSRATEGCFDIAVQSSPRPRGEAFSLIPARHAVRLAASGIVLDFGGFAKGYALERIRQMLDKEEIDCAVVNFGNSSVLAVGTHPYGEGWAVGLADPYSDGEQACNFTLRNGALSVSGHTPEHPRHIISPVDGHYVGRDGFIAVEGRSPLVAEVLSTALFAAPQHLWPGIMAHYEDYRAVRVECAAGTAARISVIE